jgi:hypothetical protein
MSARIVSIVVSLSAILVSSASAQFLTRDTASGDAPQEFAKRMAIKNDAMSGLVRDAEKIGWDLYRYEVLSDLAGNVLAQQTTPDKRAGIAGAIVVKGEKEWRVRFYSITAKDVCKSVADVVFDSGMNPTVLTGKAVASFSPSEIAMVNARLVVETQKEDPCQSSYKTIVLPALSGGSIWVYQIRMNFDSSRVPEGQHIRYEVSADGTKILSQRDFSRRCNLLPIQKSAETGKNEIKLTNTMDFQPTEMYVYLSLRYDSSIFLATMQSNLYWEIKGGTVTPD